MKMVIENTKLMPEKVVNLICCITDEAESPTVDIANRIISCLRLYYPGRFWVYRGGSHIAIHRDLKSQHKGERLALITE